MNTEPEHKPEEGIDLPEPTAWPMVLAFGITLLLAGLITSYYVSVAGAFTMIIAVIGLFREVFPHPRHMFVPYVPEDQRMKPIKVSTRTVQHLAVGKGGHRVRIPVEVHPYRAGVKGGLAGGAAMAVLALLYGLIFEGSIWWPINLLAAAGVPSLAVADVATLKAFSLVGLVVAVVVHLAFSIMVGLLYTVLLPMLPTRFAWFWGGIVTPIMWTALMAPGLSLVNPALEDKVNWLAFVVCQIAFGVVGGYVVFKTEKVETMQSWSVAEKLGVEMQSADDEEEESKS